MIITDGLVEQHIHGAFGYDFMNCSMVDMLVVAKKLFACGVTAFFPTIMTDDLDVIKERIQMVKSAMNKTDNDAAQIAGVHLEGPFINFEKAGIHQKKYMQPLNIDVYKQIEDEIIKIVTLAPELDNGLISYLKSNGVKISAGHCISSSLLDVQQVTHLYNAMGVFSHRGDSTVVASLSDERVYVELIADSMHVCDDVLKLTFKQKQLDKVLLISDALPLAHSDKQQQIFAGQTIFNKNGMLVNQEGTFAGSSMLLCDIVKNLVDKHIIKFEDAIQCASSNQLKYHNIKNNLKVYWSETNTIEKVELI